VRYRAIRRPSAVDILIAAGLLIASLVEIWVTHTAPGPPGVGSLVAVLATVPLAWRRSLPWVPIAGACAAALVPCLVSPRVETAGLAVTIAWMVAVHAVNAYRPVREAALGTGLFLVAVSTEVVVTMAAPSLNNVVWGWAIFGAAAAAGQLMAGQRRRDAAERAEADARSRDAERRLIARELHDVVAHGVAVMVVQAGAAQQLVAADPVKAAELLEAVQRTGEQSATELRRMLSLLSDEIPTHAPQPGLADLDALVQRVRAAGLQVQLRCEPPNPAMTDAMQVTVYRIVQEGLTNALKHAPGSVTQVGITLAADRLNIEIVSTGDQLDRTPINPPGQSGSGRGLTGMRERVNLYGGHIAAGPIDTGWRIAATLPLLATPITSAASRPAAAPR
jgi:signal transduction histidine kinase